MKNIFESILDNELKWYIVLVFSSRIGLKKHAIFWHVYFPLKRLLKVPQNDFNLFETLESQLGSFKPHFSVCENHWRFKNHTKAKVITKKISDLKVRVSFRYSIHSSTPTFWTYINLGGCWQLYCKVFSVPCSIYLIFMNVPYSSQFLTLNSTWFFSLPCSKAYQLEQSF